MKTGTFAISRSEYDAITNRVNFSKLKWLAKSPASYQNALLSPEDHDRDVLIRGRASHLAIFEPHEFEKRVVTYSERRASKKWDEFQVEHAGKEILTPVMAASVMGTARSVRESEMARPFLVSGQSEVTVLWSHLEPEVGGIPGFDVECKARIDFLGPSTIVDVKTVRDASPDAFGRQIFGLEGLAQAAMYVDGLKAATAQARSYAWIAVEASRPYIVQVYLATEDHLALGRERYQNWLRLLDVCRTDNAWPGYARTPMDLQLPRWAQPTEETDLAELGLTFEAES